MNLENRRESSNVEDRRGRLYNHLNYVNTYWDRHRDTPWDNAADKINEEKFDPDKTDAHVPYEGEIDYSEKQKALKKLKHEPEPASRQDNARVHRHNWNE